MSCLRAIKREIWQPFILGTYLPLQILFVFAHYLTCTPFTLDKLIIWITSEIKEKENKINMNSYKIMPISTNLTCSTLLTPWNIVSMVATLKCDGRHLEMSSPQSIAWNVISMVDTLKCNGRQLEMSSPHSIPWNVISMVDTLKCDGRQL